MLNNRDCNHPSGGWNKYSTVEKGREGIYYQNWMLNNRDCNHPSGGWNKTVKEGREGIYN
jgi:hypothetical protein